MSEFDSYTPDGREPDLPTGYVGTCRGCGTWLRSSEFDGYCQKCADPLVVEPCYEKWAGHIGNTLALNLDYFSDDTIYDAARSAAHYALEVVGREERAAA